MQIGKPCEDIHSISHRRCKLVNLVRIYSIYLTLKMYNDNPCVRIDKMTLDIEIYN